LPEVAQQHRSDRFGIHAAQVAPQADGLASADSPAHCDARLGQVVPRMRTAPKVIVVKGGWDDVT
jgi:hypothetical protein